MPDEAIRIEGLSGLRKGLRDADRDLPKALSEAHREVAKLIAAGAGPLLQTKHGKPAKSKISASGTQGGAFVILRGPTAGGDEFGSLAFHQFRGWRGSGHGAGYAVYPTIRGERTQIMDRYANIVEEKILRRVAQAGD